ncbi:hypothetical protein AURANDRAFT_9209, partial [Aureococcus anophagefferens]
VREAFEAVDLDGSGVIDKFEMARALRRLGATSATLDDAERMLRSVDKGGDGTVDMREF